MLKWSAGNTHPGGSADVVCRINLGVNKYFQDVLPMAGTVNRLSALGCTLKRDAELAPTFPARSE